MERSPTLGSSLDYLRAKGIEFRTAIHVGSKQESWPVDIRHILIEDTNALDFDCRNARIESPFLVNVNVPDGRQLGVLLGGTAIIERAAVLFVAAALDRFPEVQSYVIKEHDFVFGEPVEFEYDERGFLSRLIMVFINEP